MVTATLTSDEVSPSEADGKGWNIVLDREPAKVSEENMTNLHIGSPDFKRKDSST